jgi:hypothetical protein
MREMLIAELYCCCYERDGNSSSDNGDGGSNNEDSDDHVDGKVMVLMEIQLSTFIDVLARRE